MRKLWIKEEYLQQILGGEKSVEVRVGYPNILRLNAGDIVHLNERYPATIRRVARYASFVELLAKEAAGAIAPGLSEEALLSTLRSIYPPEKEALGVIALELALRSPSD
jgi:ASC-1-like (ASCH) protein